MKTFEKIKHGNKNVYINLRLKDGSGVAFAAYYIDQMMTEMVAKTIFYVILRMSQFCASYTII